MCATFGNQLAETSITGGTIYLSYFLIRCHDCEGVMQIYANTYWKTQQNL